MAASAAATLLGLLVQLAVGHRPPGAGEGRPVRHQPGRVVEQLPQGSAPWRGGSWRRERYHAGAVCYGLRCNVPQRATCRVARFTRLARRARCDAPARRRCPGRGRAAPRRAAWTASGCRARPRGRRPAPSRRGLPSTGRCCSAAGTARCGRRLPSRTDSSGAPLEASVTSGTIRPRHPNAASSQPANSAARARSAAAIDRLENDDAVSRTGRQIEEMRERRAPSRQPRPADVGEHGVLEERRRRAQSGHGIVRIEDDPIGQRRHAVQPLRAVRRATRRSSAGWKAGRRQSRC